MAIAANKSDLARGDIEQLASDSFQEGWFAAKSVRSCTQQNGYMCCTPFLNINQSTALNQAYSIYIMLCAYKSELDKNLGHNKKRKI